VTGITSKKRQPGNMQTQEIDGIVLTYPPGGGVCRLAKELWGLQPPKDYRIHVMTSTTRFVFQSAPWAWKLLLAVTIPF